LNFKKIKKIDLGFCYELIKFDKLYYKDFKKIGRTFNQIKKQLSKENNLSVGAFENNILNGFILGDIISIEKDMEYEILMIYVKFADRRKGIAANLLDFIEKEEKGLKKIYLEVSNNNNNAISFYEKHNFKLINTRLNYYSIDNKKYDAKCYLKIL